MAQVRRPKNVPIRVYINPSTSSSTITLGNSGTSPNAQAATLISAELALQTVSTTYAGLMSAADKTKLDGISPGGGVTTVGAISGTSTPNALTISGVTLTGHLADTSNPGFLTAADKVKLNATSGTNTGDVTLTAVGAAPSANAASLSSQALTLQPADGTHPGVMTSGTQTIGGAKTFNSTISASNLSGTNTGDVTIGTANGLSLVGQALSLATAVAAGANGALLGTDKTKLDNTSGTNTGDVTLTTVGSSPSGNAASLSGQQLRLQPADGTNPGVITAGTQTVGGDKTFTGNISAANLSGTNTGDVTLGTFGSAPDAKAATLSGQVLTMQPADATHPGAVTTATQTLGAGTKSVAKLNVTDTSGNSLVVDTSDLVVDATTHRIGIGTATPGGGYSGAADMSVHVLKNDNDFVYVETLTSGADAGLLLSTVTTHEDFGVFVDESDSRKVRFATGNLDSDASRIANTRLWLTQAGSFGVGITPVRTFQVQGTATVSSFSGLGHTSTPQYQVDLGSTIGDCKLALYNDLPGGGSSVAGWGIQSADVRSFVDFSGTRWSWGVGPGYSTPLMTLSGAGVLNVAATNGITINSVVVPTISSTSTLTNKTLTSPTINAATLSGTLAGSATFSGDNTYSGLSTFTSGIKVSQRSTTATTVTMLATDHTILASANSGAVTVNLQAAATAGAGRRLTVVKTDAGVNAVTLDGSGAETINGATTLALPLQYNRATIECDGTTWFIICQ